MTTSTTSTTPKKPVSPRHALLENLIGIVSKHAGDQFLDLSTNLAGALIDATGGDPTLMQARIRAGNKLRNGAYAFLHIATTTLEKAIRKEIAQLAPNAKASEPKAEGPLTLVPFEEMDNKVALSGVSKPFESLYADQLQTLNVRLAFLLDRDILRVSQNPFRPEVFLVALQDAWVEFDPEPASAGLIQPFIKPGLFIDMGPMLDALNLALQRQGVLPGSVDSYKNRKSDKTKAPARVRGNQAELAQQLRQLFATPEVAGKMADELASTMVGNMDLSIPDLPQAALQATTTWVPNAAAAQAGVVVAGQAPAADGAQAGSTPAPGFMVGAAGGVAGNVAGGMAAGALPAAGFVMAPAGAVPGGMAVGAVPAAGFVMSPAGGVIGGAAGGIVGGVAGAVPATGFVAAPAGSVIGGAPGIAPGAVVGGGVPMAGGPIVGGVPTAAGAVAGVAGVVGGVPGVAMVGVAGGMPGGVAGAGFVGAPGVGGVQGGVAVPSGAVVMPADGWAPGSAIATGGGGAWVAAAPGQAVSPELAQQLSQMAHTGNRQPLFNYLTQLQHAVPYESIGAGYVAAAPGVAAGVGTEEGGAASNGAAAHGAPMVAGNVIYLPAIKQQIPQGSLTRSEESTIDLLTAVFDTVFRDQNISQEIRDLIRFLQIPVLKAALRDKDFFFQEAHPARRMIDLLSRMGWEQRKGPEDPLFQAMQRSVDRVGRDYDKELSVFTEAVNELEAQIEAEEKAAATAIAEPIAAALKQEKMAAATKSAKDAIALRIGSGEVIAVVEAFLEQRWVSVLTIAYSIEDEKPGAVGNATRTMDDLIWSVRPKITPEERKQLISKLPGLLSALNKWLDVIKWQDSDRLQFFAELAECHASIVRAPLEVSPERQLEISIQVAQQAAERRAELAAQAPPPPPPEPEDDDAIIEVDSLARGMWLGFEQEDGSTRKVKLAWISPRRTLYIFSTAARQEAFSISGEALAQKFRDGLVQVLRADSVVSVALSQALGGQAVNDDSIDPPQSAVG